MKALSFSFIIIVLFLLQSCEKSNTEVEKIIEAQGPPESLHDRFALKSLEYIDNHGETHLYSLSMPSGYKNQSDVPVVVYLHGSGGNENSGLVSVSNFFDDVLAECDARRPLIVFPSDANNLYRLDQNYHIAEGLLEFIAKEFDIAGPQQRVITGFSNGGAAATRAAITNPISFARSYSWAGWVWPKDTYLFDKVEKNAEQLKAQSFKAVFMLGDKDEFFAYDPLIEKMEQYQVSYQLSILKDQGHDLSKYFPNSKEHLKTDLCQLFTK